MSLEWRTPAEAALCSGELKKKMEELQGKCHQKTWLHEINDVALQSTLGNNPICD